MKLQTGLMIELNTGQRKNLTTEVKETLASPRSYETVKIFSAAELWKIRQLRKNFKRNILV